MNVHAMLQSDLRLKLAKLSLVEDVSVERVFDGRWAIEFVVTVRGQIDPYRDGYQAFILEQIETNFRAWQENTTQLATARLRVVAGAAAQADVT